MIYITEQITSKLPGSTSLFVKFNYNQEIINDIKKLQTYNYDPQTKIWEISVCDLSKLLDYLCVYDDITFDFMPEKNSENVEPNVDEYITKPFDYQMEGIKFGLSHNRWLLLDAPGLGKTLQIIYIAQELKQREHIEHCLIICGVNTLKTNWVKEIKKHSNLSCKILGERKTKTGRTVIDGIPQRLEQLKSKIDEFFVITNIETLRNESIIKEFQKSKVNKFDMIVVDEIHVAKSSQSQQGKNLLKLNMAKYRIGATGTLLTGSPLDCFVPLKWIGAERANFTNFKFFYCIYGGAFNHDLIGYKNIDQLKDQLDEYSLRRTKDILKLPPKVIINEYVDMTSEQEKLYDDVKKSITENIDKIELDTTSILSMVTRLRQVTACPQFLTTQNISSAKVERAIDLTEQIISNNKKVVIFSTFKETAKDIYQKLSSLKIPSLLCTGDVDDKTISKNIDNFQSNDKYKVFVGTWQKCGTGITLTVATYMIFTDTPWTSAVYTQAQDRIYRVGTTESVTIYNLICSNTVDERVLEIVNDKEMLSDYVIDDRISENTLNKLKQIISFISSFESYIFLSTLSIFSSILLQCATMFNNRPFVLIFNIS